MVNATDLISKYEKYYFKETYEINISLGINGIRTTKLNDEKFIVDKLKNGIHDQYAIAWKLGSFRSGEDISSKRIRGTYGKYYDMSDYIDQIEKNRSEIIGKLQDAVVHFNGEHDQLDAVKDLSEAFDIIKSCNTEQAFGTVYMINTMFFLTQGEIPIYDKNVYRAIQALYLSKSPKDIIVSDASSAKDSMGAMFRLIEYLYLLDQVFGEERKSQSKEFAEYEHVGYISRGLDRALWVYGQCTEKYV